MMLTARPTYLQLPCDVLYPDTVQPNRLQGLLLAAIDANDSSEVNELLCAKHALDLNFADLFDRCYCRPDVVVDETIKIAIAGKALTQQRENQPHGESVHQRFAFVLPDHLQQMVQNDERKLAGFLMHRGFPVSTFDISRANRFQAWFALSEKYQGMQNGRPYTSFKRRSRNMNGAARFPNGPSKEDEIVCRHLALLYLKMFGRTQTDKVDFSPFASVETIAKQMPPDADEQYRLFTSTAKENYLIDNDGFGKFLAEQFASMANNEETLKKMLLRSTSHAMAVVLKIKTGDDGKKEYVVLFYDPNSTTNHRRFCTDDPDKLKQQALVSYLPDEKYYYPQQSCVSLISIFDENAGANAPATRTLSNLCREITPMLIWHLLQGRYAKALEDWQPSILRYLQAHPQAVQQDPLMNLLAMALQEGHTETIRAYGQLLALVPGPQMATRLPELLAAKNHYGVSGLHMVLQEGHAEAIQAYGEMLAALIPETHRATVLPELLAAQRKGGVSGLSMAVQKGHAKAIRAYSKVLAALIPETQRAAVLPELLAVRNRDSALGLCMALQQGHADTIRAYGELLALIPEAQRATVLAELLAARDEDGVPGLYLAVQNSHAEAIRAYGELLALIPDAQRVAVLPDLLAAKAGDGMPALYMALFLGRHKGIRAYGELLGSTLLQTHPAALADIAAAEWKEANRQEDKNGQAVARRLKHTQALDAYRKNILSLLPKADQMRILVESYH